MSCSDVAKVTGQHLQFLGTSTASWLTQQFQDVAKFASIHILAVDTRSFGWVLLRLVELGALAMPRGPDPFPGPLSEWFLTIEVMMQGINHQRRPGGFANR